MQSKCVEFGIKKSRFAKGQEAKDLLSNSGIKTPSSKISKCFVLRCIKMNEIVNKFLLVGDKFMPEMHLKQPGFTYSACGPFTRNKEIIEKFMQTGNVDFIYRNELDKACFQHDLEKRIQSDKVLTDKTFQIANDPNMMVIKEDYLEWFTGFLIRSQKEKILTLNHIINLHINFIRRLLENLRAENLFTF